MAGMKDLILRGGLYMIGRQVGGMALSLAALLGVARMVGPAAYGSYASAFGLYSFVLLVGQWGLSVYLVRHPTDLEPGDLHQAFTLLLVSSMAIAMCGPLVGLAAEAWTGIDGLAGVVAAVFLILPVQLVGIAPSAVLERALDYRSIALAELAGQTALCVVSLALAWGHAGVWAPVGGLWAQQLMGSLLAFRFARYRPRLQWDRARARDMLGHGVAFTLSIASWQMRLLVNPLLVARILGAEAAATVAVAIRLVEGLSFMRSLVWRIAVAGLGRIQGEPALMASGVAEGMRIQVLVIGPMMVAFSTVAPWLVPLAFGRGWDPVAHLFPFLALAYLVNAVFLLHCSALYVLRRAGDVTAFHLVHVVLFAGSAALLVPGFGLLGYGLAEMVALASYGVIHVRLRRAIGPVEIALGMLWAAGFAGPLFAPTVGPWAWLGGLALLIPPSWQALARYWLMLKESALGKGAA